MHQERFENHHSHLAANGGVGMSEDEVKSYVKRKLGDSVTEVELEPADMDDIIRDTKRWFVTRVGNKMIRPVRLFNSTSVYKMDQDVIEVIDVWLPTTHFPAVDTDDFSYTYSLLFGQWRSPGASPMPYSDLVQRLQYLKMSSTIFSADRSFKYTPRTRELEIMPAPSILGTALAEVWSGVVDTRSLQPEDEDLFLRWAVAEAKIRLGNIRQKFATYTTVAGDRGLNAAQLKADGEAEMQMLRQQALNWKHPITFIVG